MPHTAHDIRTGIALPIGVSILTFTGMLIPIGITTRGDHASAIET